MTDFHQIHELLRRVRAGELTVEAAVEQLRTPPRGATVATNDAAIDVDRQSRCGYPEVIFCEGKTPAAVADIFDILSKHGQNCLGTRVSPEQAHVVTQRFPDVIHNSLARTLRLSHGPKPAVLGQVAVITAGTSDRPVAEEAVETARWMGCLVETIIDVGVAGPHRLIEQKDRFNNADVVVVVAGMEGALPSVVGGHVDCPVIAVPTSVGYGASFGGVAALLGMLNNCAPNVTVVNIDAGFKGGYVAGLIARRIATNRSNEETPTNRK